MSHLRLVHSVDVPAVRASRWQLTGHDLITLSGWTSRAELHGYVRCVVDAGSGSELQEDGGYALLYAEGATWADWGLARSGDAVVVWACATGADLGRFASMAAALDALPAWPCPARKREAFKQARAAFR